MTEFMKAGMPVDEKAFEESILRLEKTMYRTACAILWRDADADDAMQEAILKAWRKLPHLKDETKFDAWLMRILVNECRDARRRMKRLPMSLNEGVGNKSAEQAPEDGDLREALKSLPEKYRLPLLMHHMDGYALQDISRILRLPVSTVKGRLYEARKRLKTLLTREAAR